MPSSRRRLPPGLTEPSVRDAIVRVRRGRRIPSALVPLSLVGFTRRSFLAIGSLHSKASRFHYPARLSRSLLLADGPAPAWNHRRVRWPDFWIPVNRADALDALREAHRRARAGERVEVACLGGVGRTGTALAALAVLDGLPHQQAVTWIRDRYHQRAVETPWQRRWLRAVH